MVEQVLSAILAIVLGVGVMLLYFFGSNWLLCLHGAGDRTGRGIAIDVVGLARIASSGGRFADGGLGCRRSHDSILATHDRTHGEVHSP